MVGEERAKGGILTSEEDFTFPEDPGLSWSQLRAFITCARRGSFLGAAAALGLTASAVRYQIALLEHRLRIRLFDRRGGTLSPTEVGSSLLQQIERPMHELMSACATATASAEERALTLTAPPLFARQFLFEPRLLAWCDANHVKLDITDTKRDLQSQRSLAAIRLGASERPGFLSTKLLQVSVIIAAAPNIAGHARPTDRSWWAQQMLLGTTLSDAGWKLVWNALGVMSPQPLRTSEYSSYGAALEAAASGHGIVLAPMPLANVELSSGRLQQISSVSIATKHEFSLVMREDLALSRRGQAMRQQLLSTITGSATRGYQAPTVEGVRTRRTQPPRQAR